LVGGLDPVRYPIRGIFVGCCASADGAVVSKKVISDQTKIFPLIVFPPAFLPTDNWPLPPLTALVNAGARQIVVQVGDVQAHDVR
jgi:hypothetical protein